MTQAADLLPAERRADPATLLYRYGTALNVLGRPAEAAGVLGRATALAPRHAGAWLGLGIALTALDRFGDAEAAIRRALALLPDAAGAWASLGTLLMQQTRTAAAIEAYATAVRLRPDFAPFRYDLGFARLLAGDYAGGWEGLCRRKPEEDAALAAAGVRGEEWQGSEIAGRTLLLCATQGLGDAIQFARYIPLLAGRGARLVLCCQRSLHRLLAKLEGVAGLLAPGEPLPALDGWLGLGGLARRFATTEATIPAPGGYLRADPGRTAAWRAALGGGRTAGLVWAGNPHHANDARRSLPPAALAPVLAVPGWRFASLQVGGTAAALGGAALDLAPHLADLAETAAAIAALDLVVSVDTAVAHLAGALGRPAWVALPYAPDWRWQLGRTDSPWYGSLRLFRQPRPGDWAGVAGAMAAALRDRTG